MYDCAFFDWEFSGRFKRINCFDKNYWLLKLSVAVTRKHISDTKSIFSWKFAPQMISFAAVHRHPTAVAAPHGILT
jgi:hypothetical protein